MAVNPGEPFRKALATQLDAWRQQLNIGWSRPQTWHLTLAFLGEWPADRVDPLKNALAGAAAEQDPFQVRPGRLDGFPSLGRARVLFLQMESDGSLENLAAAVRSRIDAVWPEGPQDRKRFKAHLTIARIRRPLRPLQRRLLAEIQFLPWQPLVVGDFRLVSSELCPQGARHTDLRVFPLGKGR